MNDKLIMENYLLILKSTVEVFVHGTLESSNPDVRKLLKKGLDMIMQAQADTYDTMTNNGWYTINNVQLDSINQTIQNIQSEN